MSTLEETYSELDRCLRPSSIAQIGGFRPPEDKITSWFGGPAVGVKGEVLPTYNGRDMFSLLQVKVKELPFVPDEIKNLEFIVVFINREEIPFDKPHGDGWEIREYSSTEDLILLPASNEASVVKDYPIKWVQVEDDTPDWENASELIDLSPINEMAGAEDKFFEQYNRYPGTKFGGYPKCIQHEANLEGFVFQIGSEEKPNWLWADNGIGYFNKNKNGVWVFECQFY